MNSLNYACTYAYVHGKSAVQTCGRKIRERVEEVKNDESGMEIIAVILIIVVVLALVVIFRKNIMRLAKNIWNSIFNQGEEAVTGKNETGSQGTNWTDSQDYELKLFSLLA